MDSEEARWEPARRLMRSIMRPMILNVLKSMNARGREEAKRMEWSCAVQGVKKSVEIRET